MKGIMIFDFEDDWVKRNNIKLNNLFGHVVIYEKDSLNEQCDYTNRRYWCFNSLKPLPQKKEVEVNKIEDIMHTEYSIDDIYKQKYVADIRLATDKLISLGWNACLDEILGETGGEQNEERGV